MDLGRLATGVLTEVTAEDNAIQQTPLTIYNSSELQIG